ncbi:HAD-IIB family hydrolase [bacterium]|nr:HAD-IIB family hydrolase [bacterium]
MKKQKHNTVLLFSTDLDGTLVGKPDATTAFRKTWNSLDSSQRPLLCFNSGRLLNQTLELMENSDLPTPDYLICGVGSLIYDVMAKAVIKEFSDTLTVGWDLKSVEKMMPKIPNIEKQPKEYQHHFKSSWHYHNASVEEIDAIKARLKDAGLDVNVIYSSSRDLDILPKYANKGNSLNWLLTNLGISPDQVVVAGDTGNDISMFSLKRVKGIIVNNAQPELFRATIHYQTYVAEKPFADGVLEGLIEYGVIRNILDPTPDEIRHAHYDPSLRHVLKTEKIKGLGADQLAFIELAREKAIEAIRKNITPLGFSACSIEENFFQNSDQNYKSVWARDGAISLIGTVSLQDSDIRECQENTLRTLLKHVSPYGLVPSNVLIDDQRPDYSGIGGISSVDGGLWLIIACYYFVKESRNYDFLREWYNILEIVINRLRALDSNNDMLLEIPEAGDWTDLFGRSYNILVDEVLWYYANFSFARMAELTGQFDKAIECLRWAQGIKEAILEKFWPTQTSDLQTRTFADQQFSLGDTSYLLAEITPFSFDWRCDVLGNILACLFNVLDLDRSQLAFRYMWGVGVNDPWPTVNLYPPVNAGDPSWRAYYTVNLLNLPHHYHNGGIWPFIGGEWVCFLSRLGLRDIAHQELFRLAEINQKGIHQEWEFNEWYHGVTGRPMGKAFQAWSASGFIKAYHELQMDS